MTRKEMAEAIYDMGTYRSSKKDFVKKVLNGVGAMKPMRKPELTSWYERLKEDRRAAQEKATI